MMVIFGSAANSMSSISDVAEKSTLSATAKEWYPPGYQNSPSDAYPSARNSIATNSVQSRLNKYRQSGNDVKTGGKDTYDAGMVYLYDIIKTLTRNPGEFDELIYMLMNYVEPHFQDVEIVSRITATIFKQALAEQNFQYSGVRMLAVLDENCPLVRAYLHSLCEKELETAQNLQNLTLFYAQIYSQLNYELFGKCLLKALEKLPPSPDNVKYICQTLKLTGAKLEALDKDLINEIINQLNYLCNSLPSSMSFLVQSVIKLRKSNWGQVDIQAVSPPSEPYEWSDGPVFYGPDGVELTSEESEFLAENLNDFIIDDTNPDMLWNPEPEMNEEIQEAFAEFVRSNQR